MGIMMAPVMVGMSVAPVISGVLVEHVSWRWIFFLDVPIGAVPLVLALAWLREQKLPTWSRFDLPGLAPVRGWLCYIAVRPE